MSENMDRWEEWISSCVQMHENGKCAVEDKFKCSPSDMTCPFHLTAEQKAAFLAAWRKRMNELPNEEQQFYADTYYKGKMPWREVEDVEPDMD